MKHNCLYSSLGAYVAFHHSIKAFFLHCLPFNEKEKLCLGALTPYLLQVLAQLLLQATQSTF